MGSNPYLSVAALLIVLVAQSEQFLQLKRYWISSPELELQDSGEAVTPAKD
ncbi:MAG: hypothetical protein ACI9GW_001470 [Halieaceae bacterium]